MRILTIGSFDIVHHGHLDLLNKLNKLGDVVVGVNSDAFIKTFKPSPIMTESERMAFVRGLGYECHLNTSAGRELIELIAPDMVAVGSDWGRKDYLAQIDVGWDWLEERNISLLFVSRPGDISSSELKARIKQ